MIQVIDDNEMPVTWNIKVEIGTFVITPSHSDVRATKRHFMTEMGTKESLLHYSWNMVAAETMDGFSVEIRQDSIDIRCDATNGYSAPLSFNQWIDDVAERTLTPSDRDFGAEALDIAVTFITETVTSSIDYDTNSRRVDQTIHLWVGTSGLKFT